MAGSFRSIDAMLRGVAPLPQLLLEPAHRLGILALCRAVQLDEAQEQVRITYALQHLLKRAAVERVRALHLAPDPVRAIVELDRVQDVLVVRIALGEAPRPHRVVILPRAWAPLLHLVLEGVVDKRDEAQPLTFLAPDALGVDAGQQVGHMRADTALWMGLSRLAPGEALDQFRVLRHPPFQLVFRLEAADQVLRPHNPLTLARSRYGSSAARRRPADAVATRRARAPSQSRGGRAPPALRRCRRTP